MAHLSKPLRDLLGGVLKPADPRRFLVEAMVCAMNADGVIDPREIAVLKRHLAGHELFLGMSPTVADTMIAMATDAIGFAGGPHPRIPAIARGLPSRIHRLIAYAMACEVVSSDGDIATAELAFLDTLRQHLRVSTAEGLAIMDALAQRRLPEYLEARITYVCDLAPALAELLVLRGGEVPSVRDGLHRLAASLPDAVDRWWLAASGLAAEPDGARAWRRDLFWCLLQTAFGLGESDMDLAATDAPILRGTPIQRRPDRHDPPRATSRT